ncbi:hypothetical protein HXX76_011228 [Chlamydomonas incerta]|uniref:EF-hand domain-containing protein n=1 Tax=Chlamydomonas incerta TaxID=51695 RepID=A0A835VXB1_CHLIN|nr:hypothetical protein HXX76_011228 [Chlamydomonas incerta]|eukprot:KAG2428984.1 hypothetical protein HXX76_011228 [Chlamydomonas incerta]
MHENGALARGLGVEKRVAWAAEELQRLGRRLHAPMGNETLFWVIIAVSAVVGLILLAVVIWAIVTKCGRGKSAPVVPYNDPGKAATGPQAAHPGGPAPHPGGPDPHMAGKDVDLEKGQMVKSAYAAPGVQAVNGTHAAPVILPVPPWEANPQALPPGIVLAPVTPPTFNALLSNPRMANEPPYERLVLLSSRVHNVEMVAQAVLPNVAYVAYDWKNFTLQELLRYIKKVLGAQKVVSIAVVAPGSKPGSVGLLEGASTNPEKLATKTELSQFWRVMAGCVALSGTADGRRIDLLGCRLVEAPREGAALLRELWNLTTVPFAAADDALGGYMLSTFMEEPTTKQLSLISSTIPAIDLYFNRHALLGVPPPGSVGSVAMAAPMVASSAPLPPGPPPPGAIAPVGSAPPMAAPPGAVAPAGIAHAAPPPAGAIAAVGAGAAVGAAAVAAAAHAQPPGAAPYPPGAPPPPPGTAPPPPPGAPPPAHAPGAVEAVSAVKSAAPPPPAAPGGDIFTRFSMALAQRGKTADAAFTEGDKNANGSLSTDELTALMLAHVPDASAMDVKHFMAMLDTENEDGVLSRSEFVLGLPENVRIQELVRSGRDDDEVVLRLQEYLTDNEAVIKDTMMEFDANANGELDHRELQQLVACIPGLGPPEKKFILAFLYHHDANKDMRVSYVELRKALDQFGKPPPAVAKSAAVAAAPAPVAAAAGQAVQATQAQAGQVAQAAQVQAGQAAAAAQAHAQAAAGQAVQATQAQAGQVAQAAQVQAGQAAAAAQAQAQAAAGQAAAAAQAQAQAAAGQAAAAAQAQAQAAAGQAAAALPPPMLAPLGAPPGGLAPLGGNKLGPLAPLAPLSGGLPGGAPLGRPGGLAPLAPLGPPPAL